MSNVKINPHNAGDDKKKSTGVDILQTEPVRIYSKLERCPACKKAFLDYDGCLNLACPACGYTRTGGGYT